ncbi:MAG TPA: Rap1a/Tai family immunity protein [Marinobacterium sp.]|nr:Rap1a/Tai family immunity protein [Marinobacterium sp.]
MKLTALIALPLLLNISVSHSGIITVGQFLNECEANPEPCMAFVMGVVEGARHQVREIHSAQPYSFSMHGKLVCLPEQWGSGQLTEKVVSTLSVNPQTHQYSAVSGVIFALLQEARCESL